MIICHLVELTYQLRLKLLLQKIHKVSLKAGFRALHLTARKHYSFNYLPSFRDTQREYSSKLLKHSIVKRILVFKQ